MASTINMLTNLQTVEISNVKRAANKRKYAITKSETNMDIVKAVLGTPAEGETEFLAVLKSEGADETRIAAATAAYRLRKGFADALKPEDLGVTAKTAKDDDGDDDDQKDGESDGAYAKRMKSKMAKMKKAVSQTGIDPNFTAKSADPEMLEKVQKIFKANEELTAKVDELVTKNDDLEYTAKAAEFKHVPMSKSDVVQYLKDHSGNAEARSRALAVLKKLDEVTAKSALFDERGTAGGPAGSGASAIAKIEALANQLTMKADNGKEMTFEQKVRHVLTKTAQGRDLYPQYNEEKRQAIKQL